jgi:hypothetical protein
MRTASLPEGLKPVIGREATFVSNAGVLRGERGQRAGKVGLGRLGGPCRRFRQRNKTRRKSISGELEAGESERPIVAWKRGNARGAKGPWRGRADSESEGTDWINPTTEQMPSPKSEAAVGSQIIPMMKALTQVPCESRMWETRMSGLRRGRARGGHWLTPFIPCVALYSTPDFSSIKRGILPATGANRPNNLIRRSRFALRM